MNAPRGHRRVPRTRPGRPARDFGRPRRRRARTRRGRAGDVPGRGRDARRRSGGPRIAIVGRPNVGKSTLVNALLGEERVIAFDQPGTTRDAIEIPFERGGRHYTLVDTAGLRRRGKVFEAVEKFSVIKTLQAIERANVVVLVLDARAEISDQDAHIAGFVLESGRAVVVGGQQVGRPGRVRPRRGQAAPCRASSRFLGFARHPFHFRAGRRRVSARLLRSVDEAYQGGDGEAAHPEADPRADRRGREADSRRAPGTRGPSCATPIRAAAIRRSSSSTATRSTTCRTPIAAISRPLSARLSGSSARRCASSSAPDGTRTSERSPR